MSTSVFIEACATYRFLREKGYPEKATLKLVGDRHRLSRMQRNCMFRGIIMEKIALSRKSRLVLPGQVAGQMLAVDWYNVLITVESYLKGETLFVADDGVVRDASAVHGSYRPGSCTARAMNEIREKIEGLEPAGLDIYLDAPIAFSGRMADELRALFAAAGPDVRVSLERSADFRLKGTEAIIASSDSVVLDSCRQAVDIPRAVLEDRFGFSPPAVHELFPELPEAPPRLPANGSHDWQAS